jgi:hypothetical protein
MAIKIQYIVLFMMLLDTTNCSYKIAAYERNICNKYVDTITNEKGSIHLISPEHEWYVIIPDFNDSQRFLPYGLPDMFKKNGLKIMFSGKVCEIPENVRLIGTPLELISIEEIK